MRLTEAQAAIVAHQGGLAVVRGAAGSGKTASLLARHARLLASAEPERVLVLCRDRGAAARVRDVALADLGAAAGTMAVTTFHGFAHDLVARSGTPLRLVTGAEQWLLVRQLLEHDAADAARLRERWPSLGHWVGRRAFTDEVARAVLQYQGSFLGPEELRTHATAAGCAPRWDELARFADRYREALAARGGIDGPGLLVSAAVLLRDPAVLASVGARHPHVLVDDFETATEATFRVLLAVAAAASDAVVTANQAVAFRTGAGAGTGTRAASDKTLFERLASRLGAVEIDLGPSRRAPRRGVTRCAHPSSEPETVAGALLAAHGAGVSWGDMAVLVRRPRQRARAIARALGRHGIPASVPGGPLTEEPVVQGVVDLLRWVGGDEGALARLLHTAVAGIDPATLRAIRRRGGSVTAQPELADLVALRDELAALATRGADPHALAFEVWRRRLAGIIDDDRTLDVLVAFLDGLADHVERNPGQRLPDWLTMAEGPALEPDPWRVQPGRGVGEVTITSMAGAAGREWDTVVVAGCLEGEIPRVTGAVPFFDPYLLEGPDVPGPAARRAASLAEETALFELARTRATRVLLATAAPEPGQLVSRFLAGWMTDVVDAPRPPAAPWGALAPSLGVAPVESPETLSLSASKLETYEDCPLRFAYRYELGLQRDAGVNAGVGTVAHRVLERLLDPAGDEPLTRERLMELAEEEFPDDIAPYRPMVDEAWRRLTEMLEAWWVAEGETLDRSSVVAVEHRFEVEAGGHRVGGSIDRVDKLDDGTLRVLDYKTGSTPPRAADAASNLQLAVYHLAARRDDTLRAVGEPTRMQLVHVPTMKVFERTVEPGLEEETEARIAAAAAAILSEEFAPRVEAMCKWCDFHRLCPLQAPGREVGVD